MFIEDYIAYFADLIEKRLSENNLLRFQEYLLQAGIFTLASQVLSILILISFSLAFIMLLCSVIFSFDISLVVFGLFSPIAGFLLWISIKSETRLNEIERSIPDFLRQLASILRVGMSLESALIELANYGSGPLYDELKRVLIEIKFGKSFDESIGDMSKRLNSKDFERSFKIILNVSKTGGGLANVIDDVADDLKSMLILKKERKSAVMMSVMFLILASVLAAPFALGMLGTYSFFMINLGKSTSLAEVIPLAAGIYLIIHSILAGFLLSLLMYGNLKNGFKFAIPIVVLAYGIFYLISNFGIILLGF